MGGSPRCKFGSRAPRGSISAFIELQRISCPPVPAGPDSRALRPLVLPFLSQKSPIACSGRKQLRVSGELGPVWARSRCRRDLAPTRVCAQVRGAGLGPLDPRQPGRDTWCLLHPRAQVWTAPRAPQPPGHGLSREPRGRRAVDRTDVAGGPGAAKWAR